MHLRSVLMMLTFAAAVVAPGGAHAQTTEPGFALNRFSPSVPGSDWFSAESLDLQGHGRFAIGLLGDYARKPLVIYDPSGNEVTAVVSDQLFVHVGGAVNLFNRLRLHTIVPVALVVEGDPASFRGRNFATATGAAFGDIRVGADLRLVGRYRSPFTLAVGLHAHLPTGSREAFTSDGQVRLVPLLAAAGDLGAFAYAARVGFNGRFQQRDFGDQPFGNELLFGAAAGVRFGDEGQVLVGPELSGSTVVNDGDPFRAATTPLELLFGAHATLARAWRLGVGAGPGLDRAIGTPAYRVLASLAWFPVHQQPVVAPPPAGDRDGDGIADADDACPDVAGPENEDPKLHGCPDRDGDKIVDSRDACPDVAGVASDDPATNGCPPDRDGDKIIDSQDACPDQPGPANEDPAKNGCPPPPDRDGDKILDADDACPDRAGDPDPDPKKNGCPKVVLKDREIEILERIEFDTGKATIRPESDPVLAAVLRVLQQHPELTKLTVEGHTDSRGSDKLNRKLSQARVESVVSWFVERGVADQRLRPVGHGESRPIASNRTNEGRQRNRRVQFVITEREGKPIGP